MSRIDYNSRQEKAVCTISSRCQGASASLSVAIFPDMKAIGPQASLHSHKGAVGKHLHCKSVALPRPQKARCGPLHRRGLVLASAAVTENAEKLYQNLESAAQELKRTPPSLVFALNMPHFPTLRIIQQLFWPLAGRVTMPCSPMIQRFSMQSHLFVVMSLIPTRCVSEGRCARAEGNLPSDRVVV